MWKIWPIFLEIKFIKTISSSHLFRYMDHVIKFGQNNRISPFILILFSKYFSHLAITMTFFYIYWQTAPQLRYDVHLFTALQIVIWDTSVYTKTYFIKINCIRKEIVNILKTKIIIIITSWFDTEYYFFTHRIQCRIKKLIILICASIRWKGGTTVCICLAHLFIYFFFWTIINLSTKYWAMLTHNKISTNSFHQRVNCK